MEETLLTASEVATILKVTPQTVYVWRQRGKIAYTKINGSLRFRPSDINQLIQQGAGPSEQAEVGAG